MPEDWGRYGTVLSREGPKVKVRVERNIISEVLSSILANYTLDDVSVEDPPLEEVIADVFSLSQADEGDLRENADFGMRNNEKAES
jgi:ABC-2 type transport system ATP-binding protein